MLNEAGVEFWKWFQKENRAYLYLSQVDPEVKQSLMDDLLSQLHKYCDSLYFEVGSETEDSGELVIRILR